MRIVKSDRGFYHLYFNEKGGKVYESSGDTPGIWIKLSKEGHPFLYTQTMDTTIFNQTIQDLIALLWKIHFLVGSSDLRQIFANLITKGYTLEEILVEVIQQ